MKVNGADNTVYTVEVLGGHSGPITLDSNKNFVVRIEDQRTQKIKLTATLAGETLTKVYSLRSLTLEPEA